MILLMLYIKHTMQIIETLEVFIMDILILNTIALSMGVVSIVVLMALLIRSEYKLAKYNESWFFKYKGDK